MLLVFTRALLAQVDKRVYLVAKEDIEIGKLKLVPVMDRVTIEKAAPVIADGRPLVKCAVDGAIELIAFAATFEHKGARWAVILRSKKTLESGHLNRPPIGVPFWFTKCVPQGGA